MRWPYSFITSMNPKYGPSAVGKRSTSCRVLVGRAVVVGGMSIGRDMVILSSYSGETLLWRRAAMAKKKTKINSVEQMNL